MQHNRLCRNQDQDNQDNFSTAARVGWIVDVIDNNYPIVDFSGNTDGPIQARLALGSDMCSRLNDLRSTRVLLMFENNDYNLPIIIGIVRDGLQSEQVELSSPASVDRPLEVLVDGKKRIIEAESELILCCGESSIILRSDGKVVIKGKEILSRAAQSNKIKGGTVSIN
jgi:hypothetical protein